MMSKKINIVLFGIGKVGSALINKALKNRKELILENRIDLRFPVITNSTVAFFEKEGAGYSWEANFIQFAMPFKLEDVLYYLAESNLENLVAVDATASAALAAEYPDLVKSGFNVISINDSLQYLPDSFGKGVRFLAESRGLLYTEVAPKKAGREAAANALYEAILEVAENKKEVA